jgi:large repetitive protein
MNRRIGVLRGRVSARLGGGYKARVLGGQPLGYWRLDETAGTALADSSGNGHGATMTGANYLLNQPGAIPSEPSAKSIKWTTGGSTYGRVVQGTWMDVTAAASWEFWIKPVTNVTNQGIFSRWSNLNGAGNDWIIWFNTANQLEAQVTIGGAAKVIAMNLPQLGLWTYVVLTYDGTNLLLYCNGVLVATTAATGNIGTSAGDIAIGTYQANGSNISLQNHFMDEVAFYNRALSASEIASNYAAAAA